MERREIGAIRLHVDKLIDLRVLPRPLRGAAVRISRFGVGARGAIVTVIGVCLIRAAIRHDPAEAHGTRESDLEIANVVGGRWLLGAVAAGLMAYGIDQVLHARCRRITPVV